MRQVRLGKIQWLAQGDTDHSQWRLRCWKSEPRAHSLTHFIMPSPNELVPPKAWLNLKTAPVLIRIISGHSRLLNFDEVRWLGLAGACEWEPPPSLKAQERPSDAACPCTFGLDCVAAKWKQHKSWHPSWKRPATLLHERQIHLKGLEHWDG